MKSYEYIKNIFDENYHNVTSDDMLKILLKNKVLNVDENDVPEKMLPQMPREMKDEITDEVIRQYATNKDGIVIGDEITMRGAIACTLDHIYRRYILIPKEYARLLKQR